MPSDIPPGFHLPDQKTMGTCTFPPHSNSSGISWASQISWATTPEIIPRVFFTTARIKTGFGPRMEIQIIYLRHMSDFEKDFTSYTFTEKGQLTGILLLMIISNRKKSFSVSNITLGLGTCG